MYEQDPDCPFTMSSFKVLNSRLGTIKSLEKYSKFKKEVEEPFWNLCEIVYQDLLDKGFKKYIGRCYLKYFDNRLFTKIETNNDNTNDLSSYFSIDLCGSGLKFGLSISDKFSRSKNLKKTLDKFKKNIR